MPIFDHQALEKIMKNAVHTSDRRHAEKIWRMLGGVVIPVRRTGEMFYVHPSFTAPIRINGRRHDVPAKVLSRINQLLKMGSANDGVWEQPREC
ncbi:MAG TPA: hypothetical protein PK225_11560 [Azonexus sp.]|jgi:hypothetical protein|nr:hypothetical protein [Azonexus sp.]